MTCRLGRDGPLLVSLFGALGLGWVEQPDRTADTGIKVASLLDIAGAKAVVVQKRAEAKDYQDIAALLRHGVDLPSILSAASVIYGDIFNPLITLKALSYFDDVPDVAADLKSTLLSAVAATDPNRLPRLKPYRERPPP